MSGITTTPHLHLQIDTEAAPFQPYWPFSLEDAGSANMSFFDGVSNGLNQDLIDQYSVNPIDFIKYATAVDGSAIPQEKTTIKEDIPLPIHNNTVQEKTETKKSTKTSFSDISTTHKYYNAISYFAKKKVLS